MRQLKRSGHVAAQQTKIEEESGLTRKYSLVIESDEAGCSAYVAELPTILVTGRSFDELSRRATEAIQLWWENSGVGVAAVTSRW
jgi:hypothetical protein